MIRILKFKCMLDILKLIEFHKLNYYILFFNIKIINEVLNFYFNIFKKHNDIITG